MPRAVRLIALLVVALGLPPARAAANGLPGESFVVVAHAAELATPDVRYEFAEDDHGVALTWPVGYSVWSGGDAGGPLLRAEIIAEPQLPLYVDEARLRGAGWLRFHTWDVGGWGGYADAGYVVGQDGHGPAAGGGIAIGESRLWMLGLGARYAHVDDGRIDVGLDVRWWLDEVL